MILFLYRCNSSLIKSRRIYIPFQRRSNFAELIFMIVDKFIKRITNAGLSTLRCTSPNRIPLSWPEPFRVSARAFNVHIPLLAWCTFHNKINMNRRDGERKNLGRKKEKEKGGDSNTKCICVEITSKRMHIFFRGTRQRIYNFVKLTDIRKYEYYSFYIRKLIL